MEKLTKNNNDLMSDEVVVELMNKNVSEMTTKEKNLVKSGIAKYLGETGQVLKTSNNKAFLDLECKAVNKMNGDLYAMVVSNNDECFFEVKEKGRKFKPEIFKNVFLEYNNIKAVGDSFLQYKNGVYKQMSEQEMKVLVQSKLEYSDLDPSWVKSAVEIIRHDEKTFVSYEKFLSDWNIEGNIINTKNCLLRVNFKNGNIEVLKHNPDVLSTIQLNVDYDSKKNDLTNWNKFINTSLNTDSERMLLQEVFGYHLINHLAGGEGQAFFVLDGEGGNGKGTFERIKNEILGSENVNFEKSKNVFDSGNQNQFYGFGMVNKLSISIGETGTELKNLELPKALSGDDDQEIEIKNQMKTIKFKFKGKLTMSVNRKTRIRDSSKGVKRRIIFIKMDNNITEQIIDLDTLLRNEKQAIFNWALEGLSRLIKNGWKWTKPQSHFDCFNKHFEHSDNFLSFVRKHIVSGTTTSILKTDIFSLMNSEFGNIYKKRDDLYENFEKTLLDEGIIFESKKVRCESVFEPNKDKKVSMGYYGLKYVESKECIEPEVIKPDIEYIRNNIGKLDLGQLEILQGEIMKRIQVEKAKDQFVKEAEALIKQEQQKIEM
jgi:P4 family phage/plasmid primase-like protien